MEQLLIIEKFKQFFKEDALRAIETEIVIDKNELKKIDDKLSLIYTLLSTELPKDAKEKVNLISQANEYYADFLLTVKTVDYLLRLDKNEYLFLKKFFLHENIYGRDDILFGRDIKDNFFLLYDTVNNSDRTDIYKNADIKIFKLNTSMLSKMTYILGNKKTKGVISNESDVFCKIIDKFALIGHVTNPLEDVKNAISNKMDEWRAMGYLDEQETTIINS